MCKSWRSSASLADRINTGDGGSSNTRPEYVITPLQGLQAALEGRAEVLYDDGRDLESARETAQTADVVLLVVGYTDQDEGEFIAPDVFQDMAGMFPAPSPDEAAAAQSFIAGMTEASTTAFPPGGDRVRLTLRPEDETLIQTISAQHPRTIVAIMAGSAVIMESWREAVSAIVMLWYPGMEGGHALADMLLGKVNPSGKLPFVIPRSVDDLPFFDKDAAVIEYDLWHGYRKLEREANSPAFPFGFGLSYTSYHYQNLIIDQSHLDPADTLKIRVDVTNKGLIPGEEICSFMSRPSIRL